MKLFSKSDSQKYLMNNASLFEMNLQLDYPRNLEDNHISFVSLFNSNHGYFTLC